MEHKIKGRSRKERQVRRLTDGMKRSIVYILCLSLIGTGMMSSSVFADEYDNDSDPANMIVYPDNAGSAETANDAVRSGGGGNRSGNSAGNKPVITADDVESASNAKPGNSSIIAEEVESAPNAKKTSETVTYQEYADGITVTVEAPEGALPEGVELKVERYMTGSDEFSDAAEAIGREADDENMAAVDIHFELDGEEVEPSEEVTVSINVSEILTEEADPSSIVVKHLEEVKPVVVVSRKKGEIDEDNAVVTFTVKSFSTFTIEWDDDHGEIIYIQNTDGDGDPLEGAGFVMGRVGLYAQNISIPVDGTDYYYEYLIFTWDSDTDTYLYNPDIDTADTRDAATALITDDIGLISISELYIENLYFLIETKAPDGYAAIGDPIIFYVDHNGVITLYLLDGSGNVSATGNTITVVNAAGVELPLTGGFGMHGFYMIGFSLVGSSLCLLMFLRRRRRWEDGNRGT